MPVEPPPRSAPPAKQVLLVDDDESMGRALYACLASHCDLSVAASIDEALSILDARRFDVVISDLDLGEPRNGAWLLREVAVRQPAAKRIILSGARRFGTESTAIADLILRKPAKMDEILKALLG